jgi:hypothetical protein
MITLRRLKWPPGMEYPQGLAIWWRLYWDE